MSFVVFENYGEVLTSFWPLPAALHLGPHNDLPHLAAASRPPSLPSVLEVEGDKKVLCVLVSKAF